MRRRHVRPQAILLRRTKSTKLGDEPIVNLPPREQELLQPEFNSQVCLHKRICVTPPPLVSGALPVALPISSFLCHTPSCAAHQFMSIKLPVALPHVCTRYVCAACTLTAILSSALRYTTASLRALP